MKSREENMKSREEITKLYNEVLTTHFIPEIVEYVISYINIVTYDICDGCRDGTMSDIMLCRHKYNHNYGDLVIYGDMFYHGYYPTKKLVVLEMIDMDYHISQDMADITDYINYDGLFDDILSGSLKTIDCSYEIYDWHLFSSYN